MALIGLYVGVIPVTIGMLWLPWIRRIDPRYVQFLLALTLGLLAFLGVDAALEGTEIAATGSQAFGGAALVFLGAGAAYLALVGVDGWLRGRRKREESEGAEPVAAVVPRGARHRPAQPRRGAGDRLGVRDRVAGAGHRAGGGLRAAQHHRGAGDRRARGQGRRGGRGRAPGPADRARRHSRGCPRCSAPSSGASAFNPSLAAFMFGLGAGAIAQVIVQIAPGVRDTAGRLLHPLAVGGLLTGPGAHVRHRPADVRLMATRRRHRHLGRRPGLRQGDLLAAGALRGAGVHLGAGRAAGGVAGVGVGDGQAPGVARAWSSASSTTAWSSRPPASAWRSR